MQKTKLSDTDFAEISGLKWEINELKHRINKLEKTPKEPTEWQEGEEYYYVNAGGMIISEIWGNFWQIDEERFQFGNVFKTRKEAENHKLRIESLKSTAKPGEDFWVWDFVNGEANFRDSSELEYFPIEPKFKTEKECNEWYKEYGKAWLELIN